MNDSTDRTPELAVDADIRRASTIPSRAYTDPVLHARALETAPKAFDRSFERILITLGKTRPTAVNLSWALQRMRQVYLAHRSRGVAAVKRALKQEAQKIYKEDIAGNRQLGKHGVPLLRHAKQIMTHCNAGGLATAEYGTALGGPPRLSVAGSSAASGTSASSPAGHSRTDGISGCTGEVDDGLWSLFFYDVLMARVEEPAGLVVP